MKTIIKYLKAGSIPSIAINTIWHFTSITPCSMLERIAGWSFVWLFVSATIWTFSGITQRIKHYRTI